MILTRAFHRILLVILSVHLVLSLPRDVVQLKKHFYANLLEETRDISSQPLTDKIERSISLKTSAFLETIGEPLVGRSRRDTTDLLLNEKTTDVFILKGFDSRGFVPINFPQDICMFQINRKIFAAGLSYGKVSNETSESIRKPNTISIFVRNDGKFLKIYEYQAISLAKMDCQATKDKGFVAVVNTISENDSKEPDSVLENGSFVISVTLDQYGEPKVETFQKFSLPNQNGVQMGTNGDNTYLVFSYNTNSTSPIKACTIYKLAVTSFNPLDDLPCQNTHQIEFFTVDHNLMVFIGNYRGNNGTTKTFSSILRYDLNLKKFVDHQKIFTNAIGVAKYFFLDHQEQRQHFLFIGNTFEINEFGVVNYDVPSMIYKYVNGFFIPMQTMSFKHVQAVLPIIGKNNQFHLLIASEGREVQIYFYDGWKFNESPIDFTGDAFKAGVVSMRGYDDIINETTTIVISNQDSFDPTWNIYTPIYAMKNDNSKLQSTITKWCTEAFDQLEEFDVNQAEQVLKSSLELTDPLSEHANFMGRIYLSNSTIGTVQAKQLKGTRVLFNNASALQVDSLSSRLKQLSSDVHHVNNKIRFTMATQRSRRQVPLSTMMVKNLVVDGPIIVETINGRPITDLVYKSNLRNLNMRDIIANEVLISKELFVRGKIDGVELFDDNVILDHPSQTLRPFAIDKLTVETVSNVESVNAIPFDEFFKLLRRKFDRKIPNMINQLNVETLNIGELLNQHNFTAMVINSLKTSNDQHLLGVTNIGQLTANRIRIEKALRDQKISNVELSKLININDTSQLMHIKQDIGFANELNVNRLFVTRRINNINVVNGQLQVLRKQGVPHQVVTGEKFFDQVNLLSPILLQGKIESKTLEKMNPIITINENLVLQGDYEISGPVLVRRFINVTEDISTLNPKLGFRNLLENGLNLFTSNGTNNRLVFQNLVRVKRNLQVETLNQKLVKNFVKLDYPEIQVVGGVKTFKQGLLIDSGTVQARFINDVDIDQLNLTTVKRASPVPQFIDGTVEIVDLKTPQLVSPNPNINGKSINLIFNANKNQDIGKMVLNQAAVKNLQVTNLHQQPDGKIFGEDVNFLIDDTVTRDSPIGNPVIAAKQFNDLKVQHLTFSDDNEWKSIITNYENSVAQDINVTESWIFNQAIKIGNLQVSGTINDVSYHDMVYNWLQVEGDQVFTSPQTIASMTVDNNLVLQSETINEKNIGKMIAESIWIDSEIYVENVVVNGEVLVKGEVYSPSVNNISLEHRLILNNTNEPQTLKKLFIERNIAVEYINFTTLNGIDCERFMNAFSGDNETINLMVLGSANFNYQPNIVVLNDENIKNLYENIWIADRDAVLTGDDIQFLGSVRSNGPLYADTINALDLVYMYQNYMSLTANQNLGTYLMINGTVFMNKALFTQKAVVQGSIKADEQDTGLKIDEFAKSILRLGHVQTISGNWKIKKLVVHGDFVGVINGLNFYEDVLHTGNWKTAVVTGSKFIGSINAYSIKTTYINGVDIIDWVQNAILLNSSTAQSIDEHVDLASPSVFYDNIDVTGAVNGITLNPSTVLTKSGEGQIINGDVTIRAMTAQGAKPLFIDSLILYYGINGKNLSDVYQHTLKASDTKIDSKQLVFDENLIVSSIEIGKNIYDVSIAEFLRESDASNQLVKFQQNLKYLTHVGKSLKDSIQDVAVELNHFEHHQLLEGVNIQKTVPFTINLDSTVDYAIGIHEKDTNTSFEIIRFYRWNRQWSNFTDDSSMIPLKYSTELYEITKFDKVAYKAVDHLFVEVFDKSSKRYFQNLLRLDPPNRQFLAVVQADEQFSSQFFTLDDGASACYGVVFPSFKNLNIACEGLEPTILKTDSVRKVSSQNGVIILLTDDHQLQIWYQRKIRQVLKVMNPQSFASIRFNGKFYLAVSSDKVDQSIHHGSIEIFESGDDINFSLVQSLELENPFLVEFSVIPSGDLLLYILTRNAGKTLSIYKFAGASYFVESIGTSTIVNTGSDLSTMNIDGEKEFIAIVSGQVYIIEAVMKKY